jgi:hypothetical protein
MNQNHILHCKCGISPLSHLTIFVVIGCVGATFSDFRRNIAEVTRRRTTFAITSILRLFFIVDVFGL